MHHWEYLTVYLSCKRLKHRWEIVEADQEYKGTHWYKQQVYPSISSFCDLMNERGWQLITAGYRGGSSVTLTFRYPILLTFSRSGAWMGLRVHEHFSLSRDGSFRWEWEDSYGRIPYRQHTDTLDQQTTSVLLHLFQAGLPSLRAFQEAHPSLPLLPDTIPASWSIQTAKQHTSFLYPLDTGRRSIVQATDKSAIEHAIAPELKRLLDEFIRLRKASQTNN